VCYNCGCKLPFDDHGDPANLVEEHLKKSSQTEAMGGAGIERAKENTAELLRLQKEQGELGNPKQDYNE
jgi:hypothetical protein